MLQPSPPLNKQPGANQTSTKKLEPMAPVESVLSMTLCEIIVYSTFDAYEIAGRLKKASEIIAHHYSENSLELHFEKLVWNVKNISR